LLATVDRRRNPDLDFQEDEVVLARPHNSIGLDKIIFALLL